MNSLLRFHRVWLIVGIAAAFAAARAQADPPSTDPSNWKCAQCPFLEGYTAEARSRHHRRERRE